MGRGKKIIRWQIITPGRKTDEKGDSLKSGKLLLRLAKRMKKTWWRRRGAGKKKSRVLLSDTGVSLFFTFHTTGGVGWSRASELMGRKETRQGEEAESTYQNLLWIPGKGVEEPQAEMLTKERERTRLVTFLRSSTEIQSRIISLVRGGRNNDPHFAAGKGTSRTSHRVMQGESRKPEVAKIRVGTLKAEQEKDPLKRR